MKAAILGVKYNRDYSLAALVLSNYAILTVELIKIANNSHNYADAHAVYG